MILPAQAIRELSQSHRLIQPFYEKHRVHGLSRGLAECGYDIAIDQNVTLYPITLVNLTLRMFGIRRPSFLLASSYERFQVPRDIMFRIVDKSTWIRRGLTVHNTVAEPGWKGYLTLELANQGPEVIRLLRGMPIAQVMFYQLLNNTETPYDGKYQDQPPRPVSAIMEK